MNYIEKSYRIRYQIPLFDNAKSWAERCRKTAEILTWYGQACIRYDIAKVPRKLKKKLKKLSACEFKISLADKQLPCLPFEEIQKWNAA